MDKLIHKLRECSEADKLSAVSKVRLIYELAHTARINGLLMMEEITHDMEDKFLKMGILDIIDGVEPQIVEEKMLNLIKTSKLTPGSYWTE